MAKNFLLRAEVALPADETVVETEIDLGAYVNLGTQGKSSLLRIHAVDIAYQDVNGLVPVLDASASGWVNWVLTTTSSTTLTRTSDRSVIASGGLTGYNALDSTQTPSNINQDMDMNPRDFADGYDLAVDSIFIRGASDNAWNETIYVSIVLECEQVAATQARTTALAISQT